jgi:hypothetical protein
MDQLRDKALEYSRLARQRAQDQQSGGSEFFKRLLPLPYPGGEAAWRVPVELAVAIGGRYLGEHLTGKGKANPEVVARLLQASGRNNTPATPLSEQIKHLGSRRNQPVTQDALEALERLPANEIADLAGKRKLKGSAAHLSDTLKGLGLSRETLQEAYIRAPLSGGVKGKGEETIQRYLQGSSLGRWGGGVGGFLAAGALTGLPMAIRGAALRRSGGEMAHAARNRMLGAITEAEKEQFKRDNILRTMNGEPPVSMTEWKERRKQLRQDWRESTHDYRAMAKARRQGMRQHGTSAPPIPTEEA